MNVGIVKYSCIFILPVSNSAAPSGGDFENVKLVSNYDMYYNMWYIMCTDTISLVNEIKRERERETWKVPRLEVVRGGRRYFHCKRSVTVEMEVNYYDIVSTAVSRL